MNIFCFLREDYRDYSRLLPFLDGGAVPVVFNYLFEGTFQDRNLPNQILISLDIKNVEVASPPINLEFVLEYGYRRYPVNAAFEDLVPRVSALYSAVVDKVQKGDAVISCGSGSWASRTLYEVAKLKEAKAYFLDTYILGDCEILSSVPFEYSCYGEPRLAQLMKKVRPAEKDFVSLFAYRKNPRPKYDQPPTELKEKFDIFVPGQVLGDTNVVLVNSMFRNTEEMCCALARRYPSKTIAYKKHPGQKELDEELFMEGISLIENRPNVQFVDSSVYSLMRNSEQLHVYSSSVGLEAELLGYKVEWHSDCVNSRLNLNDNYRRAMFFACCEELVCKVGNCFSLFKKLHNGWSL